MMKLVGVLVLSVFLVSCVGMQIKENCQKRDWQELGRQAGRQGLTEAPKAHVDDMKLCREHSVEPNRAAHDLIRIFSEDVLST